MSGGEPSHASVDWLDSGDIGPSLLALACNGDLDGVDALLNATSEPQRALKSALLASSYVIRRSRDADQTIEFLRRMIVAATVEE